ncbi:MAG: hypothetical protein U9O90_00840 [Euryarchaeota archaeon]|nr:hypothetical protein [Euryarchaeota archaeon]
MESSTFYLIIQVFIAIGTVAVAILAIWGEKIRNWMAGPILEFKLHNARGDLTTRQDGQRTIYYHVKIENKRQWSLARRVRILCTAISKKAPDGSFVQESLIAPVQLTWVFQSFHELLPNVATDDICDLGFLDENSNQFWLSLYIRPNNFRGFISANEAMRVSLIASADNFTSKSPYVLEISWDGNWSSNLDEMRKHLVIKEVRK